MGIFTRSGLKLGHHKRTSGMQALRVGDCDCKSVVLPMKQHIGAACEALVKPGERVLAGQLIGDTDARVAAPVHASISGLVKKIGTVRLADGEDVRAVEIESDGLMEHIEYLPPRVESLDDFIAAVRASGLVGLGGAGYPAHAKLRGSVGKVDTLLVNGAECEPFVTADHREMLDAAADVIDGIHQLCRWMEIGRAVIGIENNKPDAIALLRGLCAGASTPALSISVKAVPSRYPQGSNKQLSQTLTGRVIPLGGRLSDVGLVMMNVVSTAFLGRYLRTGKPLISRTVTIDGDAVPKPVNLRVPIGISLRELLAFCGMAEANPSKIILGGPMMGRVVPDLDTVIGKCDGAVLLLGRRAAKPKPETPCIRCGACVSACPMRLRPLLLERACLARETETLVRLNASACLECGCCAYICPAGRELVQRIQRGKKLAKGAVK
ncbi:MAG: electron transport complex subunit RsxC [Oscillospiraceae bacterium]|nr:electron transport complex subunit RsxC [Oscillospiraceae bacterium]